MNKRLKERHDPEVERWENEGGSIRPHLGNGGDRPPHPDEGVVFWLILGLALIGLLWIFGFFGY